MGQEPENGHFQYLSALVAVMKEFSMSSMFRKDCDVAVIGGGVAGAAAALQAARSGKKTVLIEKTVLLGGLATTGLIYIYLPLCDGNGRQVTFGICEELIKLSLKYGPGDIPENWQSGRNSEEAKRYRCIFSPAAFMLALDEVLQDAGVEIWLDTLVCGAEVDGNSNLKTVIVENKSGRGSINAARFIDASGDCDVARHAGASCLSAENYLAMWALEYNILQKTNPFNTLAEHVNMFTGGYYPEGRPDMPEKHKYNGLSGRMVSDFVLEGRRLLREHYQKIYASGDGDRKNVFPLKLPAMAQFRKTFCIQGQTVLQPVQHGQYFEDSIGMAADWRKPGFVWEIPYGTLVPLKVNNLLAAGRCTSSAGDAWEVTRVIPAAALTGQIAGLAAALSIDENVGTAQLDVKLLQKNIVNCGIPPHLKDVGL